MNLKYFLTEDFSFIMKRMLDIQSNYLQKYIIMFYQARTIYKSFD